MCVCVCVCVCVHARIEVWHIRVSQSIIALKVAIETLSLSGMASDSRLHLIYTQICLEVSGAANFLEPFLHQIYH